MRMRIRWKYLRYGWVGLGWAGAMVIESLLVLTMIRF